MLFKTQKKTTRFLLLAILNRATFVLRKFVARFHATNHPNMALGGFTPKQHLTKAAKRFYI